MLADQRTPDHRLTSAGNHLKLTLIVTVIILFIADVADSACRSGYYHKGRSCLRCPTSCVRCSTRTRCAQCISGRYGSYCQYTCRIHCTSCTADNNCQGCKTGYYGYYCQRSCFGCSQKKCRKSDGYCTFGCKGGYYQSNSKCKICPRHCSRCSSSRRCSVCMSGYWGAYCQYSCAHCTRRCFKTRGCTSGCTTGYYLSRGKCYQCPANCDKCSSSIRCTHCRTGFWGSTCQYSCLGCQGTCDKTLGCTGTCSNGYRNHTVDEGSACEECPSGCSSCSSSSECHDCVDGRWGSECQSACDRNCKLSKCDKKTGVCINDCNAGYKQKGTTCIACPVICADCQISNVCSVCRDRHYLSDNMCYQCPAGCESCSNSTLCTECISGWYGLPTCSNKCSVGCNGSVCDQVTGECINGCLNTYYSDRCECTTSQCAASNSGICSECSSETWYLRDKGCCPCNRKCKDNTCYANGTCKECVTGKFSDFCENDCSSQCRNSDCDRHGLCFSCIDGYYGTNCKTECNSTITDCVKCLVQNGSQIICTDCIAGKHPSKTGCIDCSQNCKDELFPNCNPATGVCKYGCKETWSGPTCNIPCFVPHCELCNSSDENVCLSCFDGFYTHFLATCQECSKTCKQGTACDKSNGLCIQGCKSGWWGRTCDKTCSNYNCIGCDQDNGKTCVSCIVGKFGETCDKSCSTSCKTKTDEQTCEKISGRCILGCEEGYWSETCSKTCPYCGNYLCSSVVGRCLIRCKRNYYGDSCQEKCSEHCNKTAMLLHGGSCNKTGKCYNGCEDNWWGDRCDRKCSDHCKKGTCDEKDGRCEFGCTGGYRGKLCTFGPSSTAVKDKSSNRRLTLGLPVALVLLAIAERL